MFKSILALIFVAATAIAGAAGAAEKEYLILELKSGEVKIELLPELAPLHVDRVKMLARAGAYDGIAFHRVIDGFMAQSGDVQFGTVGTDGAVDPRAGKGGSDEPDLPAEFTDTPFERGVVGAARTANPDSANSQFFIMFDRARSLDGQYTVWGRVVEGMENVDNIKRGDPRSGAIDGTPDSIVSARIE